MTRSGRTLILRNTRLACTLTALLTEGGNQMSDQLFAAIRRAKVKPGMADEFAKRVKAGALPVMQKMDGFKGYYLVAGADDTIIAVSLFTNKAVAQSSTQTLMPWIKENLGPLLASPTEAIDGMVVVSA
jgi:quinol monooxygenase YgiN